MPKEIPDFNALQKTLSPQELQKRADEFLEAEGLGLSLKQKNRPPHVELTTAHGEIYSEDPTEPYNQHDTTQDEDAAVPLFEQQQEGSFHVGTTKPKRKRIEKKANQNIETMSFPNKNFSLEASTKVLEGFIKHFSQYLNEETKTALSDKNSPAYAEFRDAMTLNQQALLDLLIGKMLPEYEIQRETKTNTIQKKEIIWQDTKNNVVYTSPQAGTLKKFFQGDNSIAQRINSARGEYIQKNKERVDSQIKKLLEKIDAKIDFDEWQKDLLLSLDDIQTTTEKLRKLFTKEAIETKVLEPSFEELFARFSEKRQGKEITADDVGKFAIGLLFQEHFGMKPTEFALGLKTQKRDTAEKEKKIKKAQPEEGAAEKKEFTETPLAMFDRLVTKEKINPALNLTDAEKEVYIQQLRNAVLAGRDHFETALKEIRWGETIVVGSDKKTRKINHNAQFLRLGSQNTTVTGTNIVAYCFEKGTDIAQQENTKKEEITPFTPSLVPGPFNTPSEAVIKNVAAWNEQKTENPTLEHEYFEMIAEMYQLHKYLTSEELFEFEFTLFTKDGFSLAERAGNLSTLLLTAHTRAKAAGDGNAILDRVRQNNNGKTVALLTVAKDLIASTEIDEPTAPVQKKAITPLEALMAEPVPKKLTPETATETEISAPTQEITETQPVAPIVEGNEIIEIPENTEETQNGDPEIQNLQNKIIEQLANIYDVGAYEKNLFIEKVNSAKNKAELVKILEELKTQESSIGWRQIIASFGGMNGVDSLISDMQTSTPTPITPEEDFEPILPPAGMFIEAEKAEPIVAAPKAEAAPVQPETVEEVNQNIEQLVEKEIETIKTAKRDNPITFHGIWNKTPIKVVVVGFDTNWGDNNTEQIGNPKLRYTAETSTNMMPSSITLSQAREFIRAKYEAKQEVGSLGNGTLSGVELENHILKNMDEGVPLAPIFPQMPRSVDAPVNDAPALVFENTTQPIEIRNANTESKLELHLFNQHRAVLEADFNSKILAIEQRSRPEARIDWPERLFVGASKGGVFEKSSSGYSRTFNAFDHVYEVLINPQNPNDGRYRMIQNTQAKNRAMGYFDELIKGTMEIDGARAKDADDMLELSGTVTRDANGIWRIQDKAILRSLSGLAKEKERVTEEYVAALAKLQAEYNKSQTTEEAATPSTTEIPEIISPVETEIKPLTSPEGKTVLAASFMLNDNLEFYEGGVKTTATAATDQLSIILDPSNPQKGVLQFSVESDLRSFASNSDSFHDNCKKYFEWVFTHPSEIGVMNGGVPIVIEEGQVEKTNGVWKITKKPKWIYGKRDQEWVAPPVVENPTIETPEVIVSPTPHTPNTEPVHETIEQDAGKSFEQTPILTEEEKGTLITAQKEGWFTRPTMDALIDLNNIRSTGSGILEELWSLQTDLWGGNWAANQAFLKVLNTYLPSAYDAMIDCGALEMQPKGITSQIQDAFIRSADTKTIKTQMQKVFDFCKNLGK